MRIGGFKRSCSIPGLVDSFTMDPPTRQDAPLHALAARPPAAEAASLAGLLNYYSLLPSTSIVASFRSPLLKSMPSLAAVIEASS